MSETPATMDDRVLAEHLRRIELRMAMSCLAGDVLHDLTHVLMALATTLESLDANRLYVPFAGLLRHYTELLERTLKELRAVVRPLSPSLSPVNPHLLVEQATCLSGATAQAEGVTLDNRIDPNLEPVLVDHAQVLLALRLLIEHAIRRSPSGARVEITGGDSSLDNGTGVLQFCILDHGPPIPESELSRLFVPLYAAARAGNDVSLSVARAIVFEGHRGQVTLHNPEAGGLLATMLLPRRDLIPSDLSSIP